MCIQWRKVSIDLGLYRLHLSCRRVQQVNKHAPYSHCQSILKYQSILLLMQRMCLTWCKPNADDTQQEEKCNSRGHVSVSSQVWAQVGSSGSLFRSAEVLLWGGELQVYLYKSVAKVKVWLVADDGKREKVGNNFLYTPLSFVSCQNVPTCLFRCCPEADLYQFICIPWEIPSILHATQTCVIVRQSINKHKHKSANTVYFQYDFWQTANIPVFPFNMSS